MIPCKTVAELLDSEQLEYQPFWRRLEVRAHLWMCRHCSQFKKQIEQLRAAARKLVALSDVEKTGGDGESLEARILRRLSEKQR